MEVEGVAVDWDSRRDLFSLDPRSVHLNHGSFGAVPIPVQRAQHRRSAEMEANPVAFFTRGLVERIAHTRAHLATFLRADPAGTALVPNATAAVTAVLRSVELAAGDEILITSHGYGAVRLAAQEVSARAGATVRVVDIPLTADDEDTIDRIVDATLPGHTRLAVVDHIASPTARLFPVARLAAELRARGALVMVDAAHAPGQLDVDVEAVGADFWLGNLHKWAFAPRPTALLAVRAEHRARMRPLVVSWEQSRGFPHAQEFAGTLDYTPWLAAPTGVHLLRTLGPQRVRSHNNALALTGQRLVADAVAACWPRAADGSVLELARDGVLGSEEVSMRLVPLPPTIGDDLQSVTALRNRLATEHRVEVAINGWRGMALLRLSAQLYNQPEDYARLAQALRQVLPVNPTVV